MDEKSMYEMKQELMGECSQYIDKRLDSEKGLIRDYIGLGFRVALGGIAIAVFTTGFFGWKSYDDVSKSMQAEIKARFNDNNPVNKYENLLKEVGVDGVVASLTARISLDDRIFAHEDALNFLIGALQDDNVSLERKATILQFAKMLPSTTDKVRVARAGRKFIQQDFKDNRESGISVILSLVELISAAGQPDSFNTDVLNILDKYKDETIVVQTISKMLVRLTESQGSRILEKLQQASNDELTKFYISMFNLRTKPDSPVNKEYLASIAGRALTFSFGERNSVTVSDFLDALSSLSKNEQQLWVVGSAFADAARQRAFRFEYRDTDVFHRQERGFVALARGGSAFTLPLAEYKPVLSNMVHAFLSRSHTLAAPELNDLSAMEFWMLKTESHSPAESNSNGDYKTYLLYRDSKPVLNESGTPAAADRAGGRMAIRIRLSSDRPVLAVYWRDAIGDMHNIEVQKLQNLNSSSLSIAGLNGPADDDF